MGLSGISKSQVSKLCKDIDERVNAFLERPYLWLDATYLKVRDGGRIVSVAAIIAVAVTTEGRREMIGLGLGPSEAEPFWSTFLKGLIKRGLKGVKLVISDAHDGLRHAITRVLGATWQRCRVHLMRNALAHVPKGQHTMVAAAIRQDDLHRATSAICELCCIKCSIAFDASGLPELWPRPAVLPRSLPLMWRAIRA
jgi:putative transposase